MTIDVFTSGVEPGGLTTSYEIKMLVLFLFRTLKCNLTAQELNAILQENALVNYFELSTAVSDLIRLGHLNMSEDTETLKITESGIESANNFENSLPFSVKEKAVKSGVKFLARKKRDTENKVEIEKCENSYKLSVKMKLDRENDLLDLSLTLFDRAQADVMKKHFLNDPELFYKGVLALLTGDIKTVGELVESENAKYYKD